MTAHIGTTPRIRLIRSANRPAAKPFQMVTWGLVAVAIGQGIAQLILR